MKIEHKLSPAMQGYVRRSIEQLNQYRSQYLQFLGQAKEAGDAAEQLRAALGQQLAIVQQTEGLPEPIEPYRLSEDGTKLIGETADAPAAAPVLPIAAPQPIGQVNGVDHGRLADSE